MGRVGRKELVTMDIRLLRADEIECRVGSVWDGGFSLLLYKDARCDMATLDETVGAANWQRDHKELKGVIYCGVAIRDVDTWVWKWDAGAESQTEKEKGEASDSFKRACTNWGIGRELYTAPRITINAPTEPDGKGRHHLKNKRDGYGYQVEAIDYDDSRRITSLTITKNGNVVYRYGQENETIDERSARDLEALLELKGFPIDRVLAHYKVDSLKDLTKADYTDAMKRASDG